MLDLTELKTVRIPSDTLDARGFSENLGRGRSVTRLGSSTKSTKKPTSPCSEPCGALLTKPPLLRCCDDERILRVVKRREKDGKRRRCDADDVSSSLAPISYTGRVGGGGH